MSIVCRTESSGLSLCCVTEYGGEEKAIQKSSSNENDYRLSWDLAQSPLHAILHETTDGDCHPSLSCSISIQIFGDMKPKGMG